MSSIEYYLFIRYLIISGLLMTAFSFYAGYEKKKSYLPHVHSSTIEMGIMLSMIWPLIISIGVLYLIIVTPFYLISKLGELFASFHQ